MILVWRSVKDRKLRGTSDVMCEVCVRKFTTSFCSRYRDNISHFLHSFFVQEIFSIFASSIENIVLISYIICLKPTTTPQTKKSNWLGGITLSFYLNTMYSRLTI